MFKLQTVYSLLRHIGGTKTLQAVEGVVGGSWRGSARSGRRSCCKRLEISNSEQTVAVRQKSRHFQWYVCWSVCCVSNMGLLFVRWALIQNWWYIRYINSRVTAVYTNSEHESEFNIINTGSFSSKVEAEVGTDMIFLNSELISGQHLITIHAYY